jgi:hypothetical protein
LNYYSLSGFLLSLALYGYTARDLARGQDRPGVQLKQNLTSWLLWAILDAISAISLWQIDGNYLLAIAHCCGEFFVVWCIWKGGRFSFTWIEYVTIGLVICALASWFILGPRSATILGTIGVIFASCPQIVDAAKEPWKNSFELYLGFLTANILGTIAGNEWSLAERLNPATCAVLSSTITIVTARRFFGKEPNVTA